MQHSTLIGITEAGRLLGVCEARVRQLTNDGTLPSIRVGGSNYRVFTKADVLKLAAERAAKAAR